MPKITEPYSKQQFDWESISANLIVMRNGLEQAEQTDAATLCDNAYRMIQRLWTQGHEASLHISLAKKHIDDQFAIESLDRALKILNQSTSMGGDV